MSDPALQAWIDAARAKLANGGLHSDDLDALARLARRAPRQRLLYLHASTPSVRSGVLAMTLHEPIPGWIAEIDPDPQEWPYRTVQDAILDGWQVIHFPDQRAPFEDREIDLMGYEFILQKLEFYDE